MPASKLMTPMHINHRLLIFFSLSLIILASSSVYAKRSRHHRVKNRSPEQLLKEFTHIESLHERTSPAIVANVSFAEIESSVVSWTGARISKGSKLQRQFELQTENGQSMEQHHQQQQQQQRPSPQRHATRRKTKSGLLIESNITANFTQNIATNEQHMDATQSPTAPTSAAATSAETTKILKRPQKQQQQQHQQQHQHQQERQRKRNGRGQNHKLHRNALRLLNSQTDAIHGVGDGNGSGGGGAGGLFPPLFNVAPRAVITVNATCGQNGREEYCKLVDAYPHKKLATQCGICNAQSSDAGKQRPIEAIISNSNFDERWWQSPTLQYGRHYEYVTITMDLKQIYQVFFIMIKSANSPRPASWILERSIDGHNYAPWQYFGISDADCRRRYGLAGQNGKHIFHNDTEIMCTTQFSKALPLENGEVHVSLLKNRPGAIEQSPELMNFISARYIRIRLQGMHSTANLDNSIDWQLDAQSLEKRSFYSLKQIRVSARLDCRGHAEKTVELAEKRSSDVEHANAESTLRCVCQHNTCGADCSECCALFWDKPFRNGTGRQAHECEICQCNGHAESCAYDAFLDRGICQDCRNNTTGNECEFCLSGHYRPLGAPPSEPCRQCECSARGSDGNCRAEGGDCVCREGFRGPRCEECDVGYYGDDCRKCECDSRGTVLDTKCSDKCHCKSNVGGSSCSTCLPGFFGLTADNPDGCTQCWCSGVGTACSSAQLQTLAFETLSDWKITDITRSQTAVPSVDNDTHFLVYGMYDLSDVEAIYWQAPQGYLGNRLISYGSRLAIQVNWVTIRGDTSGKPTTGPDVILCGRNGLKIAIGDREYDRTSSAVINVTLHEEEDWYHIPGDVQDIRTRRRRMEYHGSAVTRSQLLSVLASLDALLIRGAYHTDQVETSLEHAIIFSGGSELGGTPTTRVEQCVCPTGYTGLSCEGCDFGYIRVYENSSDHQMTGKCIPCPCNGHSNSCDLQSGGCGECVHNTYGERCERCKVGYYGNPLHMTADDCKRCACPLSIDSNNFSPSCQLKTMNSLEATGEYVCTQCPEGYTGDHCEMCDDGYYGNPTEIGSQCRPCECDGGPCDVFTGECIVCRGYTEGWHCERCKIGYWGDPAVGCDLCDCNSDGSDSDVCDSTDGQCLCKPNFAGQKCDECSPGYANIDLKCSPCDCDAYGSEDEDYCDPDNGQCECKPGVVGLKCNECDEGYFGLKEESEGCTECQCSQIGAVSNICEKISGQCACLPNVTGRRCEKCKSGHWNLTQTVGCTDCRCDPAGSRSHECNPWTGQCDCKIGVGGQRCNECTDGFYGFSANGCQPCTACTSEGQVCDPLNGRCICPPNSRGLGCAQCTTGTWGWQPRFGCRNCECDPAGSIGQACDATSGQCQCREGYGGRQCNSCAVGYFGYPECRRCNCDVDGSFVGVGGLIACDANGQCPCKSLVVGLKCDTCKQSTFGLSALNPEGCTRCFCFGRSSECEVSEWSWGHIRMAESRNLSVQYVNAQHVPNGEYDYIVVVQMAATRTYMEDAEISVMNGLSLIPSSTGNISIGAYNNFYHPLYFQLPPQFYGDRSSSYGGYLFFTLLTDGAHTPLDRKILSRYPLVQIHAHSRLILDFYEYEEYEYSLNVTHKVPIQESFWKYHHNNQAVDRPTLMAALQNIRHIFLRAFTFADFSQVVIQNVHMDSAIYVYGSTNMIAKTVERCKCPKRFDGLSCQDPGKGFYRWRNVTEVETVFIEDLIGRAAPCHCNGRSSECDRETGVCLYCGDHTGGDHCDQCAEGYYGDPNSPYGCQPCPCPETSRNFAKGCNMLQGEVSCICKPGYAGNLCDRCGHNYFGDPLTYSNSTCKPCDCNLDGAESDGCDSVTGQCHCRSGVGGLKCDECLAERHYLENRGCRLCDNCTLTLLDYVELISNKLRRGMHNMDLTGIPAPYSKVEEFEGLFNLLNTHLHDYNHARHLLVNYDTNALLKLNSYAENEMFQARRALATAKKRSDAIGVLQHDAKSLFDVIGDLRTEILQTIYNLNHYGKGEQHLSLSSALEQARSNLEAIQQYQDSVENMRSSLNCAWEYFYLFGNASDETFDLQGRVEMLRRNLNRTNHRVSDMHLLTDRIFEMQSEIEDVLEHVANIKSFLLEDYEQIRELRNEMTQNFNQGLIPETDVMLDINLGRLRELEGQVDSLAALSEMLNSTLIENESIHREVKKHWLPKAQKHAQRLMERSNEYARQFQPTRNGARIAMLASSAHKNISDAIAAAHQASIEAKERVSTAQSTLYPNYGISVIDRAKDSLNRSNLLQKEALHEMQKTNYLKQILKIHEDKVDGIKSTLMEAGMRTNNISTQIQSMGHKSAQKLCLDSIELAARASEDTVEEGRRVQQLQKGLETLREKLATLEPDWEIKLGMAEENISLTKTNVRLANISLLYVEEQTMKEKAKFDELNHTISDQMQELRDKIAKAKHAAEGIKVSVESSDAQCVRTYMPTSYGPSISNTIKFSFALSSVVGNSPLVYIQGTEGRYISLELYKRHVRLAWGLGGSSAIITHPLEVQTRDPKYDDAWYHVEANRTLNVGSLLVRRMNNYGVLIPSSPVTGSTNAEHTRLFQTSRERLYLGGFPKYARNGVSQLKNGLNVVVHKVEVDNKPIGVWNFMTSEGRCGGAMIGAQESTSSSVARHFNGFGYAKVKKSRPRPYRKNLFSMQMTFKTLDEDALLLLAVDDKNNRSVSVTLSMGRILFRIDYGNGVKLEISSFSKYNTGKWVKIEAAREFSPKRGSENGILRVNDERPITGTPKAPVTSQMLPDLSKPAYYLGGVPPGFTSRTSKAPGADNPFLGCLRDVQVNGETYDPLQSSEFYGVEPSCKDIITKAGFSGNGYIELPSQSLRKRANVGFLFRTHQPDCLLLLSAYPPHGENDGATNEPRGNYSISLIDGHLQVWINSGHSLVKLNSNVSLNDGDYHAVNLIKSGRKFELYIDDELQEIKSLAGSPTIVNMPRDSGGLYIGGVPANREYLPLAPTFVKLEGSVRDVVFNNRTVNFDQAVAYANVQIGRNGPVMGDANGFQDVFMKTEPMIGRSFTTTMQGCQKIDSPSHERNAFKFGDDHTSYALLQIPQRNFWQRNYQISFDFRSFYANGVIFVSPGIKAKHKHYVTLLLKDGQLMLVVRGRRREELKLTAKLNDGEWHHVTVECRERKVTLSVEIGHTDQKTSAQMKVPKKIAASNVLYVGGLSPTPPKLPSELRSKVEPYKGCLRNFLINNSSQDLGRAGKHMNVGQCFPVVERGSYFTGEAYAVYKKNFEIAKYLEFELEFRTSSSSGILLSISEPKGSPALSLELHNGNLIFSCDLGDGIPFRIDTPVQTKYALCDNDWHNVSALYDNNQISLRIDQLPARISKAPHRSAGKLQTKSSLFIGGISDDSPSGSLLTRENFRGCIRNVSIRKERRDWIYMDELHNVLLGECPVANNEE